MKKLRFGVILGCLLAVLLTGVALAQDFPSPTGNLVNDFANVLSPGAETQLENRLLQLEKDTSAEVSVVTIVSLGDENIDDYAVGLFEKWGIGKKGKDNGVLFVVAVNERKVRIEVGYGLEAVLTDGRAGRILDSKVLPSFRDGNYETGIFAGVISIENYLREGALPSPLEDNSVQKLFKPDFLAPILIGLGIVTVYLAGFTARSKSSIWLGGIWGAVVGIVLGLATGKLLGLILVPLGLAGVGSLFLVASVLGRSVARGILS